MKMNYRIMHVHLSRILALFVAALAFVSCRNGSADESPVRRLDKEGHLYYMDYTPDYELDKVVASGATTSVDEMMSYLKRELAGDDAGSGIPGMDKPGGCSSFTAFTPEGDALFCRNYDYKHDPLAVVIRTAPTDGYSSIGVADAAWLDLKPGTLEEAGSLLAILPYATLDGMNEKGVALSVMELHGFHTAQNDPSKPSVGTSVAIRLALDRAASVDEVIELWKGCNMHSAKSKSDFHFLVSDSTGRTVVIEYVDNEMKVIDSRFVANEHLTPGIGNEPSSCPRYRMMESNIELSKDTLSTADAMNILSLLRQGGHRRGAPTQWSAVYNLDRLEMDICVGMDYSEKHHFKL